MDRLVLGISAKYHPMANKEAKGEIKKIDR